MKQGSLFFQGKWSLVVAFSSMTVCTNNQAFLTQLGSKGLGKRVEGRGVVHNGWVQQQLILAHPSVGCFVTHYGAGSLTEALMNMCQMVLLPQPRGDHVVNARVMGGNLKVGVEVERGEEDGLFKR
ncbi:hypothetical protein JHK84_027772 [Glycine max]|nr:hypothetical protein JHK84_027772 [Glycine max]